MRLATRLMPRSARPRYEAPDPRGLGTTRSCKMRCEFAKVARCCLVTLQLDPRQDLRECRHGQGKGLDVVSSSCMLDPDVASGGPLISHAKTMKNEPNPQTHNYETTAMRCDFAKDVNHCHKTRANEEQVAQSGFCAHTALQFSKGTATASERIMASIEFRL